MENTVTAHQLRNFLLSRAVEKAAVKVTEESKFTLIWKDNMLASVVSQNTKKALVRAKKNGKYAQKEYTFGTESEFPQIADDLALQFDRTEDVFPQNREQSDVSCVSEKDATTDAELAKYLETYSRDADKSGFTVIRAMLERRSAAVSYVNESGTQTYADQNGYLFHTVIRKTNGKPGTRPCHMRKAAVHARDLPRFDPEEPELAYMDLQDEARTIERFEGNLIIAPQALYMLMMDFLFGKLFEDMIASGASDWQEKLGTRVFAPGFSAAMDPYHKGAAFSERIRSDGTIARAYSLIEDGVLQNLIVTPEGAQQLYLPPCGNDGDNLTLPQGERTLDEIIRTMKKGILLMGFAGNTGDEFSGRAEPALYIENGQVRCAAKDLNVRANWMDILTNGKFEFSAERFSDGEYLLPYLKIDDAEMFSEEGL